MPNYDYCCSSCQHKFEQYEKVKNRNKPCKKPCPNCQSKTVEMVFGMPAICDPIRIGVTKPDKGWNEVLAKIKSKTPGSNFTNKFE